MIAQIAISFFMFIMMLAVMILYAGIFPVGMADVRNK